MGGGEASDYVRYGGTQLPYGEPSVFYKKKPHENSVKCIMNKLHFFEKYTGLPNGSKKFCPSP